MADVTEELALLNTQAKELLEKYDGVFSKLDEQKQQALLELASKSKDGLKAIEELLESGNVAQAEKALKLVVFDSGWIDVSNGNTYTITHNLNSDNIFFKVLYRADANSKIFYNADNLQSLAHNGINSDSKFNGLALEQKDANNVYLLTGNDYVFASDNTVQYGSGQYANGNAQTSGQVKILGIIGV